MEIRRYKGLPEDALEIRKRVFVDEQGFRDEFDDTDKIATHLVGYEEGKPVAVCRVFPGEEDGEYVLGRMAVVKEQRHKGMGTEMLRGAEDFVREDGGRSMALHAQCRASEFYERAGYEKRGEVGFEEDCPHIWMKKPLEPERRPEPIPEPREPRPEPMEGERHGKRR